MPTWFRSKKFIIPAVIILLIIGGWYWRRQSSKPTYREYQVTSSTLTETLELSGKVDSEAIATLRFGAGGYVTYIGAKKGDTVNKWETLASVDTRQLQKVLEQKLNLYAIQRGTFDDTQDDYDKNIQDGDIDQALRHILEANQYQLENAVKDVEYQDLAIRLSRINSPLDGILIHSPTNVANVQVSATDTWVVVDPDSLIFIADLDETDIGRVQEGQKVTITLDAFPEEDIISEVSSIAFSPKETTTGTTYEVKISIPLDQVPDLRLGLNGTASIQVGEKQDAATLPQDAISIESQGTIVYLKEGNKYTAQTVVTGIDYDGHIEIVSGVSPGDIVYAKED